MRLVLCLVALAASSTMLSTPSTVSAQVDGDEKCGPDGYVLHYRRSLDRWESTMTKCRVRGDEPRDERRPYGEPADGERKCGPDGYVMQYRRSLSQWEGTMTKCR